MDSQPTQVANSWRTTVRSVFQFLVGLAALVVVVSLNVPLPGSFAVAIAVCGTVTKIMSMKEVNDFISNQPLISWLAPEPKGNDS